MPKKTGGGKRRTPIGKTQQKKNTKPKKPVIHPGNDYSGPNRDELMRKKTGSGHHFVPGENMPDHSTDSRKKPMKRLKPVKKKTPARILPNSSEQEKGPLQKWTKAKGKKKRRNLA